MNVLMLQRMTQMQANDAKVTQMKSRLRHAKSPWNQGFWGEKGPRDANDANSFCLKEMREVRNREEEKEDRRNKDTRGLRHLRHHTLVKAKKPMESGIYSDANRRPLASSLRHWPAFASLIRR